MQPFKPLKPPVTVGCGLRRLTVNDLAACHHLDQSSLGGLWSLEQWQAELKQSTALVLGVVSDVESEPAMVNGQGQLLGLAAGRLVVDELQIMAMAVQPRHRRRGLGRWLLETLLQSAAAAGCRCAVLEVATTNTAARAFYGCFNFKMNGLRRNYYRNGSDALILHCELKAVGRGRDCWRLH